MGVPFCHQAVFYRTDQLKSLGGYKEEFKITADLHTYMDLHYHYKLHVKESSTVAVIFGTEGISTTTSHLEEKISYLKHGQKGFFREPTNPRFAQLLVSLFRVFSDMGKENIRKLEYYEFLDDYLKKLDALSDEYFTKKKIQFFRRNLRLFFKDNINIFKKRHHRIILKMFFRSLRKNKQLLPSFEEK